MALNFKIICHHNSDNLHLKLMGDFDGSSAHELINTLKEYRGFFRRVFIHTCSLSSVHPSGLDVFQKSCDIKQLSPALTFTGKYGDTIAPQWSSYL